MPRPKRTKVALPAPAPRARYPAKPSIEVATRPTALQTDFDDLYDVSDQEQRAVTRGGAATKTNGKQKAGRREEPRDRVASQRDFEVQDDQGRQAAAEGGMADASLGIRDTGLTLGDLANSSPDIELGRRDTATPALENSLLSIGNFRRRARQPSILGRAAARARSSSVESNLAEGNGLTGVGTKNNSALAIGAFKRRTRQPSIMGGNTAPARSSSVGLETTRNTPGNATSAYPIGAFKRRARGVQHIEDGAKDAASETRL